LKILSKIFQYAYLIFALLMVYQAYKEYQSGGTRLWFYCLFAIGAVGMFFFKKRFNEKMNKNN